MKIITYNVNGLHAPERIDAIHDLINNWDADYICLQETKCHYKNLLKLNKYEYLIGNGLGQNAGVATYSKRDMRVFKVPEYYSHRLLITYNEECVIINIYAPYGRATSVKTHEEITTYKIQYYRFIYKTIKRMNKIMPNLPIIAIGDYNMVAADNKSRRDLAPISDYNFTLPVIKRLWKLFIDLKMKMGKYFEIDHKYKNRTAINYITSTGDAIDYCLVKNGYPITLYKGYKYRIYTYQQYLAKSSDHIPLVFEIKKKND